MIELLAVTAIIVIVSTIVLANNARFGGVVQLENLAYDVALSIRQAQVYGISVRRYGADNFNAAYGVHFDLSSPTIYALFADIAPSPPDGVFEADQGELAQATTITRGYRIQSLCATPPSGAENCSVSKVDIVFRRPEPDAWISARTNDNDPSCVPGHGGACNESARIILASPRGDKMAVVVEANGQISVRRGAQ